MADRQPAVAIDFDGTLHPYTDGWIGGTPAPEPPVDGAFDFMQMLHSRGYAIVVFSTRANFPEGHDGIVAWLRTYGMLDMVDRVTHVKPRAIAYVDDRAVTFRGNWLECLEEVLALGEHPKGPAPRIDA